MRTLNGIPVHSLTHLSPPDSFKEPELSSTTTPTCNPHTCKWRPYSNSNDFGANAAVIIIVLFSALICVLSLHAAIRCFLHGGGSGSQTRQEAAAEQRKPGLGAAASAVVATPSLVYSAGMRLFGAEAECTICLSEFEEGESIHVFGRCNHGFHVQCIQEWLSSHTSCPTCRSSIFPSSSSQNIEETPGHCMTSNSQQDLP